METSKPPDRRRDRTCGNCDYYEAGECFADPPRVVTIIEESGAGILGAGILGTAPPITQPYQARPTVAPDDPACMNWAPIPKPRRGTVLQVPRDTGPKVR